MNDAGYRAMADAINLGLFEWDWAGGAGKGRRGRKGAPVKKSWAGNNAGRWA